MFEQLVDIICNYVEIEQEDICLLYTSLFPENEWTGGCIDQ